MNPIQETIFDFLDDGGRAFYGYFLQRLEITRNDKQPTLRIMGKGGRILLEYNEPYFLSKTPKERMALIEHEILHIANAHGKRLDAERNLTPNLNKQPAYLIGADLSINQLIPDMPKDAVSYKEAAEFLKDQGIIHNLEADREAEYYVQILKEYMEKRMVKGPGDKEGSAKATKEMEKGVGEGCHHFDESSEDKGIGDVEQNEAEDLIKAAARQAGTVPDGIEKVLESLTKISKPNWKQLLRMNCAKSIKAETRPSWHRLRRRSEFEVKGRVNNYKPQIVVAIDTSGSIYGSPGTLEEFTGQLTEIQAAFGGEFTVVECDASIQKIYKLRRAIKPDQKFKGGGGTDFRPVFELCEKELHPGLLIFFTDGEGAFPDKKPKFRTLWASIYDNKEQYPFGDYLKVDIKNPD